MQKYDVVIIGGGPAGLSAGIYAGRARLKTLILEQALLGGQIVLTNEVDNYPGYPEMVTGMFVGEAMEKQARKFGVEIRQAMITQVNLKNKIIEIGDETIEASFIIVATGAESRKIGVTGEAELRGRGVSYCATCDGPFFKDKVLAVVGGGDSAVEEAIYLSNIAQKVYLVHRKNNFRAIKIIQERARANPKIEFVNPYEVQEFQGSKLLEKIVLKNPETGEKRILEAAGAFIYIGQIPNTSFLAGQLDLDDHNFIKTNDKMETSLDRIYAIGDVRTTVLRQVVTAAADGAIAASEIAKII